MQVVRAYMPKEGQQVRKMRIDHRVGDTPAKQKLLRPDKRQSEDQGPVSDERQKDETADSRQHWDDNIFIKLLALAKVISGPLAKTAGPRAVLLQSPVARPTF